MKKNIGLVLVLALVIIFAVTQLSNWIEQSKAIKDEMLGYDVKLGEEVSLQQGEPAPNFTLHNLQGEALTLEQLKGKKVILNFWATWCGPCKKEMPHLQKYYEQYAKEQNVEIVGVNLTYTRDQEEAIAQFIKSHELTFPIVLEKTEEVARQYEILTIPSTFMLDTEGNIQRQIIGPLNTESLVAYMQEID